MATRPKRNFSPEFRLEAAQLVVDQHYTVREAAEAMNVGHSTMDKDCRSFHPGRQRPSSGNMAFQSAWEKNHKREEKSQDIGKKRNRFVRGLMFWK